MKKVVSQNLIEVEMHKKWLEQTSIRCTIKHQRSSGLAGEIPFTEVFPRPGTGGDLIFPRFGGHQVTRQLP